MSSFEDIYHRVLVDSSAETVFERLITAITHQRQKVSTLLFPFLQVIPDKTFHQWYQLLQEDEPSAHDISNMTNLLVHTSLHQLHFRRLIDLVLIKCV